jgi:uncharacterized membrane protein YheB (UPF0754 family)
LNEKLEVDMNMMWVVFPLIGGVIGWVTNFVAIKMLFYPRNPINLGLFRIQGVFPKRQKLFAARISKVIGEELLHIDEIKNAINKPENLTEVFTLIDERIEGFLKTKLGEAIPLLAMFINDKSIASIKEVLSKEVKDMLPEAIDKFANNLENHFDIQEVVFEKVSAFPVEKLEDVLMAILQKELKFIEIVGAGLGAIIGIIQVIIAPYLV